MENFKCTNKDKVKESFGRTPISAFKKTFSPGSGRHWEESEKKTDCYAEDKENRITWFKRIDHN